MLFQYGCPRLGERSGTSLDSPSAVSNRWMLFGSITKASRVIRPEHFGHASTSTANVRFRSSAHGR